MSTKTSIKRIALVAVSALGFGLLSVVPAKAATVSAVAGFDVDHTGITATSDVAATSGEATVYTRTGQTVTIDDVAFTNGDAGELWQLVQITGTTTSTAPDAVVCATKDVVTDTTCSFTVTAAMDGKVFRPSRISSLVSATASLHRSPWSAKNRIWVVYFPKDLPWTSSQVRNFRGVTENRWPLTPWAGECSMSSWAIASR
jgi:hypothetical protein